jgi:hypothetical protein
VENGFIVHRGLYVTGIDDPTDDHLYPVGFVVLGHQRWADIIEAAAYLARATSGKGCICTRRRPGGAHPRIPRAVLTHGVFLRRPGPCA